MNSNKVFSSAIEAGFNLGILEMKDYFERILLEYEKGENKSISTVELRTLLNDSFKSSEKYSKDILKDLLKQ